MKDDSMISGWVDSRVTFVIVASAEFGLRVTASLFQLYIGRYIKRLGSLTRPILVAIVRWLEFSASLSDLMKKAVGSAEYVVPYGSFDFILTKI